MLNLAQLIRLMLMVGASTIVACPDICMCRNYPRDKLQKTSLHYTSVSCEGYDVDITQSLDNNTRDFQIGKLNGDELQQIFEDFSQTQNDLPHLVNFAIISSEIENLNANVSINIPKKIIYLTLIDNRIKTVPFHIFQNLSDLQCLDLSNNDIKALKTESFRTLRTLQVLNLSANSLTELKFNSFSDLKVLKYLDLSKNKLSKLGDGVLRPLSSLQHLNLSSNRLESLDGSCFEDLPMLQQLDVSHNRLARVAPGSLQLPSLVRLLLAGNPKLGGSRDAAVLVGTGRRLQTVDASRTGLKQVPAALTRSIRTLRLADNSIRIIHCGDLDSYPLLQLLDLTSNKLEGVEEDALGRLEFLTVLYLTDNAIGEIPNSLTENLKVLHLEQNVIRRISEIDLQGMVSLEVLLLNDNKIGSLEKTAFSQLVSLVTLDLSGNPLVALQPGSLKGPSSLRVLRLASVGIVPLAEEASFPLSETEHLISLDLSSSPGLARQLLADTAALAAARELQELDLSGAGLEMLRSDLLHYLPQLRALHLGDNRLNCTQLQWLALWMRRQDDPEYAQVTCSNPPSLWGTPVIDLVDASEASPTINQPGIDTGSTINLPRENATNMYRISSNYTRQYTTESTNDKSSTKELQKNIIPVYSRGLSEILRFGWNYTKDVVKHSKKKQVYLTDKIYNKFINKKIGNTISLRNITNTNMTTSTTTVATSTFTNASKILTIFRKRCKTCSSSKENIHPDANKTDDASNIKILTEIINADVVRRQKLIKSKDDLNTVESLSSNLSEDLSHWNTSSHVSMYTNDKKMDGFSHPSMIILAVGVLAAAAALAMLAARLTRRRRSHNTFRQEEFEVSSLPSVTELW